MNLTISCTPCFDAPYHQGVHVPPVKNPCFKPKFGLKMPEEVGIFTSGSAGAGQAFQILICQPHLGIKMSNLTLKLVIIIQS